MRLRLDPFLLALLGVALLGTFLPVTGEGLDVLDVVVKAAVAVLFFLYGVRLSPAETWHGLRGWRLHLSILAMTYVAFPLLGLLARAVTDPVLPAGLATGVLLLTLVPSTVQSSVAFTAIARGNVAGAVVGASLSNLLGVALTPLLVGLLLAGSGDVTVSGSTVLSIVLQLLVPFALGTLSRPLTAATVQRWHPVLGRYDRLTILLVVYAAFSKGAEADVWSHVDVASALVVVAVCATLLAAALGLCVLLGRVVGLAEADRAPLLFCGSHKSLAAGLPMLSVLFSSDDFALAVLPLMLFHQLQLVVCAWLAARMGRRAEAAEAPDA
ncbi:bile acid:sodium symporter family protein [Aeromicrobium sp. IC_218]|uniref:bile acid:sodium symporter family protein n=1 Tax=Aeromicrobium sp. IC_218 TaxID=2545468 RepID=UPI001A954C61|nr:bile acid:sodium symporter family protein [Aeromicrobium sp. IC_218]